MFSDRLNTSLCLLVEAQQDYLAKKYSDIPREVIDQAVAASVKFAEHLVFAIKQGMIDEITPEAVDAVKDIELPGRKKKSGNPLISIAMQPLKRRELPEELKTEEEATIWVKMASDYDPTPTQKYMQWIIREFKLNGIVLPEDGDLLRDVLEGFEEVKNSGQWDEEVDINKWRFRELSVAVGNKRGARSKREMRARTAEEKMKAIKHGSREIYTNDLFRVLKFDPSYPGPKYLASSKKRVNNEYKDVESEVGSAAFALSLYGRGEAPDENYDAGTNAAWCTENAVTAEQYLKTHNAIYMVLRKGFPPLDPKGDGRFYRFAQFTEDYSPSPKRGEMQNWDHFPPVRISTQFDFTLGELARVVPPNLAMGFNKLRHLSGVSIDEKQQERPMDYRGRPLPTIDGAEASWEEVAMALKSSS